MTWHESKVEVGEWYEQIAVLEKWMAGKTIEEIRNLKTNETLHLMSRADFL